MRNVLSATLVLLLVTSSAAAHGGQYKGPSDAGGGTQGGGGTSAAPTNPGGSAAPGPGAPSAAGVAGVAGGGTGGAQVRGQSQRGSRTSGATIDLGAGFEIWEFWWENNKDKFLNLKSRLLKTTNISGSAGHLTGRGRKSDSAGSSRRPTRAQVNTDIIPALIELLGREDNRDILDSAVLALGRTAMSDDVGRQVVQAALPLLSHRDLSVQSSSTLALGVLGSPEAVTALTDLLADTSAGRKLTGGGEIHWLVRAFAALSLGLINDDSSVAALTEAVESLSDSDRDIKVCAIVGLGLMKDNPNADKAVAYLSDKLKDRSLDAVIKSYIPTSLGKLGNHEAVPALLKTFLDRDTDNYVLQSTAIGLGRLATVADNEVIDTLAAYVAEGRDMQTRHFCFISLAYIGARDDQPQENAEVHKTLTSLFTREITKPDRKTNRSWGALAGAIYARAQDDQRPVIEARLSDAYEDEKDPSFRASFAVALGLIQAQSMAPTIYEDFLDSKDQDFRGYAAVALGLMNYTESSEALRNLVRNKSSTPTLRLQVATGLGLMSDTDAVDVLIETLEGAETLGVSSAVAKALGLIGDTSAIGPLKNLAVDDKRGDLTRAFAAVALGIVGEKTDLPWNAQISTDNNYRASVPAISEVLDIL